MSDFPVGPTVSRVCEYRRPIARQALAPPSDIDAMQIRPENGQLSVNKLLKM